MRINLYFQENVLEGLRRLAEARGTTYSELIRVACHDYVIREGGKAVQDRQTIKALTA